MDTLLVLSPATFFHSYR